MGGLFCSTFPSVPVFFLPDEGQYVGLKYAVENKNKRIKLMCCVCVDCSANDWLTQREDDGQIPTVWIFSDTRCTT